MAMKRDQLTAVTTVVREADLSFMKDGGSTRHWVRDHFLPALERAGLTIVTAPQPKPSNPCRCDELTATWRPEDRAALCGHLPGCPLHS